jgi:hypothetical protein
MPDPVYVPIPSVPYQYPGQTAFDTDIPPNPLATVWYGTQTVSGVPEVVMGWLVSQGWKITGISQDNTTIPPTKYYALTKQELNSYEVLYSLMNNYQIAADTANRANEGRYNQIVENWDLMIRSSQEQFATQVITQNANAGVYIADLEAYMDEIELIIDENRSKIVTDAAEANSKLSEMNTRLIDLELYANENAQDIEALLGQANTNTDAFALAINALLANLYNDYTAVEGQLNEYVTASETLVSAFEFDYKTVLEKLEDDYNTHSTLATSYLTNLGLTELARIYEQFAASLAVQLQDLIDRGLYSSAIVLDVTARNTRDRDEQIQALNDRLNREKWENQHRVYDQQVAMRLKTLESKDRIHSVEQEVLRWQASQVTSTYSLLQEMRNRTLSGRQAILAAQDAMSRLEIGEENTMLSQLQDALKSLISGKERYSTIYMQHASTVAEHKHRAIAELMNTKTARLEGWKTIADQNRQLLAYQLDERNKLIIGLYGFVERREDIAPEWKDMASMVAGLGDSSGGWIQP